MNSTPKRSSGKILLLPFLRGLLEDNSSRNIIIWTDRSKQEFKIVDSKKVAELWGATKPGRKTEIMSYDNMCKSLRTFCSKDKTLEKVEGRNFTWRFLGDLPPFPNGFSPKPLPFSIESILGENLMTCSSPSNDIITQLAMALTRTPTPILTPALTPASSPALDVSSRLHFAPTPPPMFPFNFLMSPLPMMPFLTPTSTPGPLMKNVN